MIPIYEPFLEKKTLQYGRQALESSWISNLGEFKDKATTRLVDVLNVKNCILVNNFYTIFYSTPYNTNLRR